MYSAASTKTIWNFSVFLEYIYSRISIVWRIDYQTELTYWLHFKVGIIISIMTRATDSATLLFKVASSSDMLLPTTTANKFSSWFYQQFSCVFHSYLHYCISNDLQYAYHGRLGDFIAIAEVLLMLFFAWNIS